VDGDIIPYEYGGMVQLEDPEQPLQWEILRSMVDDRVSQILEASGATEYSMYLTDSASNFRIKTATIVPYKGQRKTEKPVQWAAIRQHLIDNWNAEVIYGMEADDKLGIEQCAAIAEDMECGEQASEDVYNYTTVLCSRDKDLHMIPGWHYSWPAGKQPERLWFQDDTSAIRCFYRQLLTGDTTDNILGLYGVGAKSKLVGKIDELTEELDMFKVVYTAYTDRFGAYASQFMSENAALLWMLREEPIMENPAQEVYNRLEMELLAMETTDEQL